MGRYWTSPNLSAHQDYPGVPFTQAVPVLCHDYLQSPTQGHMREDKTEKKKGLKDKAVTPEGCAGVIYQRLKATSETFTNCVIEEHNSSRGISSFQRLSSVTESFPW